MVFSAAALAILLIALSATKRSGERELHDFPAATSSQILEQNAIPERIEHYARLIQLSSENDWMHWSQLRKKNKRSKNKKKGSKKRKESREKKAISPKSKFSNEVKIGKNEFTYSSGATEKPTQIVVEDWRKS